MLIGTHVSPAGGPAKAVARGVELGANAIQVFNQNPRVWKPTIYSDEAVEAFRDRDGRLRRRRARSSTPSTCSTRAPRIRRSGRRR